MLWSEVKRAASISAAAITERIAARRRSISAAEKVGMAFAPFRVKS